MVEKNKFFGPIIKGYGKISPYTDPVFKYTLGITPSLTWLFVLMYGTLRFFIEFLKEQTSFIFGVPVTQVLSSLMIIISLYFLLKKEVLPSRS